MSLDCKYKTKRLLVKDWQFLNEDVISKLKFAQEVHRILTPEVTKTLPDGWQNIKTVDQANHWIFDRVNEGVFLTVRLRNKKKLVGFVFLYESESENNKIDLRIGYLLSQTTWGKGYGTELINGLVTWCKENNTIQSLLGGVEKDNIASVKVLEKNGFSLSKNSHLTDDVLYYEIIF
jgi:RimJ/RimL family protein N-acetyltransferase